MALYERCSDAWEEELLGELMQWPAPSAEPAVLELLDAHGWGLVDCRQAASLNLSSSWQPLEAMEP